MRYLYAIRKRDKEIVRVLKIETLNVQGSLPYGNVYGHTETWYIVPLNREVVALTPGDFEMGYEIYDEIIKPRKSDGRDGFKISDGIHD